MNHPNDLIHPNTDGINNELQAAVHTMMDTNISDNTRRAFLPKIYEFFYFCDYVYITKLHLDTYPAKRYTGFVYLAFREKSLPEESWVVVVVVSDDLIERNMI
jgi:hypothetical protein